MSLLHEQLSASLLLDSLNIPEGRMAERALRDCLRDVGVDFGEFVASVERMDSFGFHEAAEYSLRELGADRLIVEPFLTKLSRLTANHFAECGL